MNFMEIFVLVGLTLSVFNMLIVFPLILILSK
jgi:hypothetical protein